MPVLLRTVSAAAPRVRPRMMMGVLRSNFSSEATDDVVTYKSLVPAYDGWDTTIEQSFKERSSRGVRDLGWKKREGIVDSALDLVGQTPVVRLSRLAKHLGIHESVELVAKCEFFNAGGSVKDRVALRMIEEAEREGRLKPGDVIIEPTSGNTGVGLCMAAAIKGYKVIITMPLKMSGEKLNTMKALGAEILRTPTEAGWNDEDSHISLAKDLEAASNGRAHVLDQYLNSGNPLAHFQGTAQELLQQCGNKLDVVVIASGTGGTVTGIGRGIKEVLPDCKIVAVDPVGSLLAQPESMNERKRLHGYQIEGIGYDFIPTVLDRSLIDEWVKIDDQEALSAARGAVKHEGLLVGGSSGSAIAGALAYIQDEGEALHGKRVAVLCADGVRNYMSKFMDDAWMAEHDMPLDLDFKHSILKKTGEFEPNPDAAAAAASASASDEWGASNSPSVTLLARALANRVAELEKAHASGDISDALFNERKAKLEARMAPPLSK